MSDHLWGKSLDEMLNVSTDGLHPLMESADLARLLSQTNALQADRLLNLVRWFHSGWTVLSGMLYRNQSPDQIQEENNGLLETERVAQQSKVVSQQQE